MKLPFKKNSYRWLVGLLAGALITYGASILFSRYLESELEKKVYSFHGTVSSIEVSLLARSIHVRNLAWRSPDSLPTPHSLRIKNLSVKGIHLFDFIFRKQIVINDLTIDSAAIRYNKAIERVVLRKQNPEYTFFVFQRVSITHLDTQMKTDSIIDFSALVSGHLGDARIRIDSLHHLTYSVKRMDAVARKMSLHREQGMYGGTIARLSFNSDDQKLIMDSAVLVPRLGKYEFARYRGKQVARMDVFIPRVTVEGLHLADIMDSSFIASKIRIQSFRLFSFKDKRIPFTRKENVPLPMVPFLKLAIPVKIDSIVISDSHIEVEEFPEHGVKTGKISFTNINATISNLDNRPLKSNQSYSRLSASCLLMGSGKVKALFQFPLDGKSAYTAKGSISDMAFNELNPMLTSMANVRIESGYLKDLAFDFEYNDVNSKGNINIDYHNLQLTSLNVRKRSANAIKSFFLNAIVKNHRSKSAVPGIKNGVIDIERDRKRYIFNVWWKSILDGLRSVILG